VDVSDRQSSGRRVEGAAVEGKVSPAVAPWRSSAVVRNEDPQKREWNSCPDQTQYGPCSLLS
jgi:hypothetical protein